ncbi:MAG: glycosyltransferase family 4 protein, partial [Bergeyella zoohelcum]|nr:glycosyltransferase family 4 protein [Bergeyella zoohelcum]
MKKLFRITTVAVSLKVLLRGQLGFMSSNGFEVVGIAAPSEFLGEISEYEGVRVLPVEMSRKITPFQDLKSLYRLYKIFKKEKPNIVHTHTPKAGIVGMLAARLAGVPHRLHTVAGLPLMEATGVKRRILNFVEKLTYSCATMVYPNSKGLYNFILENKFATDKKLKIIANGSSNGINTKFFSKEQVPESQKIQLKQDLGISEEDFVYVFVGRIVGDKGINELLKAFSNIKNPNLKLILVGGMEEDLDPLKTETLQEIQRNENIIEVGFQADVRPYFAISDALAFPSYREGFPNVVMQAGAMELPCIVSDINGCNEIIIENENGMIVPAKNIEKLQEKMLILVQNKELYQKM